MRFASLCVEKYGALDARRIEFPNSPGLVVLLGRNEAGKSTCLAALADFLYGIPDRTPHGQLYGYEAMRITVELSLADGSRLTFRRRKGRASRTLSDAAGNPVEEGVLARYLCGTARDGFRTLFGIDHASLRSGGEQLLRADGAVGRLIVEAGGGLGTLVAAIDALGSEAERLFAPRRAADRAFYAALDAYSEAERSVRAGLVTREAWEAAQRRLLEAKEALAQARARHRAAAERGLHLARLQRVIPSLRTLAAVEAALQGFADVADLPESLADAATRALDSQAGAQAGAEAAEERCRVLETQFEAQQPPAGVIALEAALREIAQAAVHVRKQQADRPNRLRERGEAEAKLNAVRRRLALPAEADLAAATPDDATLRQVQALAARGVELDTRAAELRERLGAETTRRDLLRRRVEERRAAGGDVPAGVRATDFASITSAEAALDGQRAELQRRHREIVRRAEKLGFASLEALSDLVCPDAAVVQAEIDRRTARSAALDRLGERICEAERQYQVARAEAERLAFVDGVPSSADLAAARAARDQAWNEVRARYLGNDAAGARARGGDERAADAERVDRRIAAADQLADRRGRDAERIAALERAHRDLGDAEQVRRLYAEERRQLDGRAADDARRWAADWPEAVAWSVDPGRLKARLDERRAVLEKREELLRLDAELARAAVDRDRQRQALIAAEHRLGLAPAAETPLAARLEAVLAGLRRREDAYGEFRQESRALADQEERLAATDAALGANDEAQAAWRLEWAAVTARLGLAAYVSPEQATEVARQWASVPGLLDSLGLTLARLRRFDEDERDLQRRIAGVAGELGLRVPADAVAAAEMLDDRWRQADERRIACDKLRPQLDARVAERDGARRQRAAAEATVAALCREAGCPADALADVAARLRQASALAEQRRGLIATITTAGDGLTLDVLEAQCAGRDVDAITAERAAVEAEVDRLAEAADAALGAVNEAATAQAAFSEAGTINTAVALREAATAEMHAVLAQHVERALARDLLAQAMEQVRRERQDPLVQRASRLFALVTRGAFSGIETDVDGDGRPIVVGVRAAGGTCHVQAMSDGTRDQLFLAFRIAAIEQYCAQAEPLPFVADDLLVHFDDARSEATLHLLAALGAHTQVLLFTHHQQVADATAPLVREGRAAVLELPCD